MLVLLTAGVLWSWGFDTHRYINREAVQHLPSGLSLFTDNASFLSDHSVDADLRKGSDPSEGPKHYIDIDEYPEFFSGTLSHDIDSLIARHGESQVYSIGVVPWATVWTLDTLIAALRGENWDRALLAAADLGHYVADAHQPLHLTRNFNGQYTGNNGIHSRYESEMMRYYLGDVTISPSEVRYVDEPIDFVFGYITEVYTYVDTILHSDDIARSMSGGQFNDLYYQVLWELTGEVTQRVLQRATVDYASLLYTAAAEAGLVQVTSAGAASVVEASFEILQNYPNPFNPRTFITYRIPLETDVRLSVHDLLGREVRLLVDERQSPGKHTIIFNARELATGMYFSRLMAGGSVRVRRLLLLK